MNNVLKKRQAKIRRRKSIRKKIAGSAASPRLAVFRSNKHIYAQLIDDLKGETLAAASSKKKGFSAEGDKTKRAYEVGKLIATRAQEKQVTEVVFDRGGNLYHGRVKALADGAREGGLKF